MKMISLLFLLFFCFRAHSQEDLSAPAAETPNETNLPNESIRFSPAEKPGMLLGILEFPVYSFYLGAPDINGVAYVPNFSPRLGTQIRWKNLQLIVTFGLPLPQEEISRRGNSEQTNLIINRYWHEYALDLYYQRYKGFYIASPLTELDTHKPDRYPQLPDAEIKNFGVNIYRALNSDKFSMSAAFNQMEHQLMSGGSWITTGFYNHLEMKTGSTLIAGSDPNSQRTLPNIENGVFDTIGAGGGYGYNWIRDEKFLAIQAILGLGAQHQNIDQALGNFDKTWNTAIKGNFNLALGYNLKDKAFGIKFLADSITSNVHGVQVYSTMLDGILFYGARF